MSRAGRVVLAGDIGGTHARFALFDAEGNASLHEEVLKSRSFRSFDAVLGAFLERAPRCSVTAATFGIAGPVVSGRVKTTNLPWSIDARTLQRRFAIPTVTLLNDLVATGLGALRASPRLVVPIHVGRPKRSGATLAVIAAGTGLGEAALVWDGVRHVPLPSEGSHVDFAPRTPLEGRLLAHLAGLHGHVSYERVASGATLHDLYAFIAQESREPAKVREAIARADDPNVAVVALARSDESRAARDAVDTWCSVYGAEAGNLALKSLSTGGVYVCGGVSKALVDILAHGLPHARGGQANEPSRGARPSPFLEAFVDKGRMRPLLEQIPIAVVVEPLAGLLGAAAHAAHTAHTARRGRHAR